MYSQVPRDRMGEFDPVVVIMKQATDHSAACLPYTVGSIVEVLTDVTGIEEKVMALYAKGVSTRDIQDHLQDLYGTEASLTLISNITKNCSLNQGMAEPALAKCVYGGVFGCHPFQGKAGQSHCSQLVHLLGTMSTEAPNQAAALPFARFGFRRLHKILDRLFDSLNNTLIRYGISSICFSVI